jgi:two-component system chemotaxis response regulator CheY
MRHPLSGNVAFKVHEGQGRGPPTQQGLFGWLSVAPSGPAEKECRGGWWALPSGTSVSILGVDRMKKVLVVEDSPHVRQQVAMALAASSITVIEAVDGVDGLEKAADPEVGLVICDVNMPNMNGLELLEKLKADPVLSLLPVMMLTSEGQPKMIERAKRAGAKGWMVKPFKADMLVAAVKRMLTVAPEPPPRR